MIKGILNQNCIPHQQTAVALDLSLSKIMQDKYLCTRCLANQSQKKEQIELIEDVQQKLNQMKKEEFSQKKQLLIHQIEKLSELQYNFQQFQNELIKNFEIVFQLISQAILETNKEFNNLSEQIIETVEEQDIIDLSNYVNKGFTQNINQINQKGYPIITQIYVQLQKLSEGDKIQELKQSVYTIQNKGKNIIFNDPSLAFYGKQIGQENQEKLNFDRLQKQTTLKEIIISCQKNNSQFYEEILKLIDHKRVRILSTSQTQEEIQNDDSSDYKEIFLRFSKFSSNQRWLLQLLNEQFNFNFEDAEELRILFNNRDFEFFKTLIKKLSIGKLESILYPNLQAQYNQFQEILREVSQTISKYLQISKNQEDIAQTNEEQLFLSSKLFQILKQIEKIMTNDLKKVDEQSQTSQFHLQNHHINIKHQSQNSKISKLVNNSLYLQTQHINMKHQLKNKKISKFSIHLQCKMHSVFNINYDYGKQLTFSKTFKHQSINISSDGRKASTGLNGVYAVCVCDRPLPKEGRIIVELKIINTTYMFVGICFKDLVKQNYVCDNYGQAGHGYYFLCINAYYCSHHEQQTNNMQNGFKYYAGDTIQMEINMQDQIVKWKNKYRLQSCGMNFQVEKELFVFCQFNGVAQVELL